MNAHALLTNQGWLGTGHALDSRLTDYGAPTYKQKGHRGLAYDPTSANNGFTITAGNGLVKPLLVSQRHGSRYGIGKKAHEPQSGNQWWLKGFQSALENIGKDESERSSGTSTPRNGYLGKHSGLYGYFVQGQLMKGTIEDVVVAQDEEQTDKKSRKRKSDVLEDDPTSKPQTSPSVKKPQPGDDLESSIPYLTERDKKRKQQRHQRAQSTDLEQFAAIGQYFDVAEAERRKKNKDHTGRLSGRENDIGRDNEGSRNDVESKEVRRARRRRRKEEEEQDRKRRLTLAEMVEQELAKLNSLSNSAAEDSMSSSEKPRPEDVKRRKKKIRDKDSGNHLDTERSM